MILPQRFKFYFIFYVVDLSMLGLTSFYRHSTIRHIVVAFYLCEDDSDKQDRFNQSNITNYVVSVLKN